MSQATDPNYLHGQYQAAPNVNARIRVGGSTLARLRDRVEAEIREQGAFRVDKISGLFIAESG